MLNDLRSEGGICVGAFLGCTNSRCVNRITKLAECPHVKKHRIPIGDIADLTRRKTIFGDKRRAQIASLKRLIRRLDSEAKARRETDKKAMESCNSLLPTEGAVREISQGVIGVEMAKSAGSLITCAALHQVEESTEGAAIVKVEKGAMTGTAKRNLLLEGTNNENAIEADGVELNPKSASEKIIASIGTLTLQARSLDLLEDGEWLNDEVINFWLARLQSETGERIHIMNTHFMTKILQQKSRTEEPNLDNYNYEAVKSWLEEVDLFLLDKLIVPINVINNHWILACIFVQTETIQIFNSINPSEEKDQNRHMTFLQALRYYVQDEHDESRGYPLPNLSNWTLTIDDPATPRQRNWFDCGVFCCMFAEFLCGRRTFDFTQDDASRQRQSMREAIGLIASVD